MKRKLFILASLLVLVVYAGCLVAKKQRDVAHDNTQKTPVVTLKGDYDQDWKTVDSLVQKGLTLSALEQVVLIYQKSKLENNAPQFVKAIIYKMKLQDAYQEDAQENTIKDLNAEIAGAVFPVKPVLHSILAEKYWEYYQQNRWKWFNRTTTMAYKKEDIKTWDLKQLVDEVIYHYTMSLNDAESLKKTKLDLYDAVIVKDSSTRKLRPTLYDFLAHRAIDFFKDDETELTKPAVTFAINSEDYFKSYSAFATLNIQTPDSLSLKYYAAYLLRDLIAFHMNDADPSALIDVDLERLDFVKSNAILDIKDSLYLQALLTLESKFSTYPASADVSYAIAKEYITKGNTYNPLKATEHKWMLKKAVEKCNAAITAYPATYGGINAKRLKEDVLKKTISITVEEGNAPEKPFRSLIEYKNVSEVTFRIVNITFEENRKLQRKVYSEELIKAYLKLPVVKEWTVTLPTDGDYQEHAAEVSMPALPLGYYVVLATDNKSFSLKDQVVAYSSFWMTNISYVHRSKDLGAYDFYVMNRETGEPLKQVVAQSYTSKYNYKTREYDEQKNTKYITDENGYFEVPIAEDYRDLMIDFTYGKDHFVTPEALYQYKYYEGNNEDQFKTFFFLDRAIYRPGQTVYFKGIMIKTNRKGTKVEIAPNQQTTVTFYDPNSQKVTEVTLTTNAYGSFTGTFTAPGALTGNAYITNGSGYQYFSIEEYKRPKFEVKINPVKGTYKLNETVNVSGTALAYAGNVIDNASVSYRVVRTASFPHWGYWWRGYYPRSAEMEITNGTTITNDKGEFTVSFKAIPDASISKAYAPTFTYAVYADVTDINGETRSTQKNVKVGYKSLTIDIDIPEKLEKTGNGVFNLYTANLNGEKDTAKGSLTIYKLKQPEKIFRERKWKQPDLYTMTKDEYYKAFPYDLYADENNKYTWEKEASVFTMSFNTAKDSLLKLTKLKEWKNGSYVLEAKTTDKYGEEIKYTSYFEVYGKKEKQTSDNAINYFSILKNEGEPGDSASFLLGTKDDKTTFLYEIECGGKVIEKKWLTLNNEQRLLYVPIKEEYRGNVYVHVCAIKRNSCYVNNMTVTVPYTNKELVMEFETFRNKLQPGQKEEWKIKIKGKNGDKVAAEMLASMYDASLDAFKVNNWNMDVYKAFGSSLYWDSWDCFNAKESGIYSFYDGGYTYPMYKTYDMLNWFGGSIGYTGDRYLYGNVVGSSKMQSRSIKFETSAPLGGKLVTETKVYKVVASKTISDETIIDNKTNAFEKDKIDNFSSVKVRSNFNETAFFYPQLQTNEKGEVIISFTVPESLTKWKMMGLATTKDLRIGQIQKELVTQKDLMIVPNAPRFFRENDKISFTAKVSNLTDAAMTGNAQLLLFDATTMKAIDGICKNNKSEQSFAAAKGQSAALTWNIEIPEGVSAISYKVVAKAGNFSDGEEMVIPVLNNRMLLTETLPLPVRGTETKAFTFEKLLNSASSSTLRNNKLTLEFTANPAWYAIQALPYMMEYPYECAEQVFSRFYANSIASHIANSTPKIKAVFDSWRTQSPTALLSNLEKNQELKSLMLEETPWVLQAQNETERKQRVALLFEMNKMSYELSNALHKLEKMQLPNGGFPWFGGMEDSRYITQHIVTGFGHLDNLGVKDIREDQRCWSMVKDAVKYLDARIDEDYKWMKKHVKKEDMDKNQLSGLGIQYLYARSYFLKDVEMDKDVEEAYRYYIGQATKYWLSNNRYMQGMIALALNRDGNKVTAMDIIKSLKENSLTSEEMGMYWKDVTAGYYWYQAPVETQALLIEAFDEVANDAVSVDNMKIWLLKQKQTQDWKTTKATSEACYALLLRGTNWLATDPQVQIKLGNVIIDPLKMEEVKAEAGTGYFKTSWNASEIKPEMGNVNVTKTDAGVSWGALYWQYFEQLDKITPAETPLKLDKKLFLQKSSATGPVLEAITSATKLKVGDKITVRIELRADRDMEYVHMKDMRASGFEPVNVLSQYKYQDGLGYYESTRDAATNFFFSYIPKGTYVFEYTMLVTHNGDFSNGITTIQCMYAPEFSSHSEGVRVKVGE